MNGTKLTSWFAAAAIVTAAAACSNSTERKVDDASRDATRSMEKAGDAARDAARDAGNAVTRAGEATATAGRDAASAAGGAVQTADVKLALVADKRVDASDINVDTDAAAKTVTLKGHVPTAQQKTIAGDIATAKADGYRVINNLSVGR